MVRRRRDQPHTGSGVARLGDVALDLVAGQLTTLACREEGGNSGQVGGGKEGGAGHGCCGSPQASPLASILCASHHAFPHHWVISVVADGQRRIMTP